MRYYKTIDNGYIISIGTGSGGEDVVIWIDERPTSGLLEED